MTQLICLVQRLFLGDEQRTLIKEKEIFEVNEQTADILIKGGIAKPVSVPAKAPDPVGQEEPENGTVPAKEAEKVEPQQQKKRR